MLNIKKIKPLFTKVVVTKDVYTEESSLSKGGLQIHKSGEVKEIQTVVAVGDSVRNIKVGDLVCVDPSRYAIKKYQENSVKNDILTNQIVGYNIPLVELDGKECMILDNNDVRFVIEEYEDKPDSGIISGQKSIIV